MSNLIIVVWEPRRQTNTFFILVQKIFVLGIINIAVKYEMCIKLLNMDYEFNECYKYHKNGNKTFLKMDWMNSLICSIWMYKYH
jgi:hypothetical protein